MAGDTESVAVTQVGTLLTDVQTGDGPSTGRCPLRLPQAKPRRTRPEAWNSYTRIHTAYAARSPKTILLDLLAVFYKPGKVK